MADPIPLSRDKLAQFLPNNETVKAFERLFQVAGVLTPNDIISLTSLINDVYSIAQYIESGINSLTAQLERLERYMQIIDHSSILNGIASDVAELKKQVNNIGSTLNSVQF